MKYVSQVALQQLPGSFLAMGCHPDREQIEAGCNASHRSADCHPIRCKSQLRRLATAQNPTSHA